MTWLRHLLRCSSTRDIGADDVMLLHCVRMRGHRDGHRAAFGTYWT